MLKLLAAPFTLFSVHHISYTSSAWNCEEGVMMAGGNKIWRLKEQNFHWRT